MASDIITPLTRVAFVYNGPNGMELAPNPYYSGGSKALEKCTVYCHAQSQQSQSSVLASDG